MVEITIVLDTYQWRPDGSLSIHVNYFVNNKKIVNKNFDYMQPFTLATIIQEVRQYAHDFWSIKEQAEALNLEQFIGVPFTEEV